jgi:DNA polymerase-3 subunit epsilon|tara:strand:- start:11965 stop:12768 length:804 start_codon:yes stop_codon:yes gene_type:complete
MILFFDTETNGLWRRDLKVDHDDQPHMVSIAAQLCDMKEKVVGQMAFRMKPSDINFIIPKDVEEIHGISTKNAEQTGISTRIALELFKELLEKTDILVAHNTAFDLQIIERAFNEFGIKYKLPKLIYCTMMMAKNEMKLQGKLDDYKFPKLKECYEYFFTGSYREWHDALTDVTICRNLYFNMIARKIEPVFPQIIPKELLLRIEGQKYQNLIKFLKNIKHNKNLNGWENNFCKSVIERLEKANLDHILLSTKQYRILKDIHRKNGK